MSAERMMADALDALLDFGRVVSTSLATSTRQVLAVLEGVGDESAAGPERRTSPLWGHAAILFRPKAPTTTPDGRCEVMFIRSGDEMVAVATRDLRWQVDLEEGDVVVRNLDGTKPVRLHLKADGTAILEADTVKIGDASATQAIGLGTAIKGHLDALKTYLDAHTHAYLGDSGVPALTTPPTTIVAPPHTPLNPSPNVPDVESRHLVEN